VSVRGGYVARMIGVENIADWRGQEVVDRNGEKLGKLDQVYFDGETDEPTFIGVKSGTISKSLTLVPLARASVGRDYVRVDRAKGEFKKAPSFDTDVELTLDDEAETYRHYGLDYTPAGAGARRLAKR
jgi:sporulation protein YlmC with PRC-barrel domain